MTVNPPTEPTLAMSETGGSGSPDQIKGTQMVMASVPWLGAFAAFGIGALVALLVVKLI